MKYFLDTNAIWYFLESFTKNNQSALLEFLKKDTHYSFYASEISMLEIYSVLGKNGRGKSEQKILCQKEIINEQESRICNSNYIERGSKKLSNNVLQKFYKLIRDMEEGKGNIHILVEKITENTLKESKNLLIKYSSKFKFESLDSVVMGRLYPLEQKGEWTVITTDQRFQNILRKENIKIFDPLKNIHLNFP